MFYWQFKWPSSKKLWDESIIKQAYIKLVRRNTKYVKS